MWCVILVVLVQWSLSLLTPSSCSAGRVEALEAHGQATAVRFGGWLLLSTWETPSGLNHIRDTWAMVTKWHPCQGLQSVSGCTLSVLLVWQPKGAHSGTVARRWPRPGAASLPPGDSRPWSRSGAVQGAWCVFFWLSLSLKKEENKKEKKKQNKKTPVCLVS